MAGPSEFHISLDSPDGTVFPSFKSSDFPGKINDLNSITLLLIRQKCKVSSKYKFTADGKNTIDDSTTLAYYVSLTPENQEKLKIPKPSAGVDDTVPNIPIIEVQLILAKQINNQKPVDSAKLLQDVQTLRDKLKKAGGVDGRRLDKLSSSVADLAALQMSFAAVQGSSSTPEPSDLTEEQWQVVLFNNQALHGWIKEPVKKKQQPDQSTTDDETIHIRRSSKRAFEILHHKDGEANSGLEKEYYNSIPGTPLFFIRDDANVTVTEIQNAFQHQLATESFSSRSIRASADFGTAASISASYDQEIQHSTDSITKSEVDSLHVSYNFPRVVVSFEPDTLQLSEKCKKDALNVTTKAERELFYAAYGNVFVTQISLGGRLTHTRALSTKEKEDLDNIKTRTQTVAGASFSSPDISASAVYGQSDSTKTTTDTGSLNRSLAMSWEAHGGDTSLCSNPPVWASTVRLYKYWRILNQSLVVNMADFIFAVDSKVGYHLKNLQDADRLSNERIREVIKAIQSKTGKPFEIIQDYYIKSFSEVSKDYEAFQSVWQTKKGGPWAPIKPGTEWGDLTEQQKVVFGCYMAYEGLFL